MIEQDDGPASCGSEAFKNSLVMVVECRADPDSVPSERRKTKGTACLENGGVVQK